MQLLRGASDAEFDSDNEDSMLIINLILNPMTLNGQKLITLYSLNTLLEYCMYN